jgi:hypothetical protein
MAGKIIDFPTPSRGRILYMSDPEDFEIIQRMFTPNPVWKLLQEELDKQIGADREEKKKKFRLIK